MKILHMTLHRKWFDQIASGEKRVEYREVKPYWTKRIAGREYGEIHFRNGYGPDRPFMRVEYKGYKTIELEGKPHYALQLGVILEVRHYNKPGGKSRGRE